MGFLKNIFKKKKGGTFVGNLLRGASSSVTGGILGSGAGLRRWEDQQRGINPENQQMDGRQMGSDFINKGVAPFMANSGGASDPTIGASVLKENLKKNWLYVVAGLGTVIGGTYFITRKASRKGKVK